uniref:Uncharacterized protein n=1 Tax=Aegilops tauschii TaxID=37682 RepID=M8BJC3_AEGTA
MAFAQPPMRSKHEEEVEHNVTVVQALIHGSHQLAADLRSLECVLTTRAKVQMAAHLKMLVKNL